MIPGRVRGSNQTSKNGIGMVHRYPDFLLFATAHFPIADWPPIALPEASASGIEDE
jgi:hypothetical protein